MNRTQKEEHAKQRLRKWLVPLVGTLISVAGFIVGLYFERWVDRAVPIVATEEVRVDIDPADKIDVPSDVVASTHRSVWCPGLEARTSVLKLAITVRAISKAQAGIPTALAKIQVSLKNLDSVSQGQDNDRKRVLLADVISDRVVDAVLTGGLARQEIRFDQQKRDYTDANRVITVAQNADKGYDIHLGASLYRFYYRDKSYDPLLKPAADAFEYFDADRIRRMFEYVHDQLVAAPEEREQLEEQLTALLESARRVRVDVLVANQGRSSFILSPWGAIHLFPSGKFSGADLVLERAQGKVLSVDDLINTEGESLLASRERSTEDDNPRPTKTIPPGETTVVRYRSSKSIAAIEADFPGLTQAISGETIDCRVALKRLTKLWGEGYLVYSAGASVGSRQLTPDESKDLLRRIQKACQK